MKSKETQIIISIILNAVIAVFTVFGAVVLFAGLEFMPEVLIIKTSRIGEFRFFTTDSNLFLGVVSIIFLVYQILVLNNKIKEIPRAIYILKFTATSAVALTFLVVFGYLEFVVSGGFMRVIKNSSLFFHLINPILAIITFVFFERTDKIKPAQIIFGILPSVGYGIYYVTNLLLHAQGGTVSRNYDFYHLIPGGLWQIVIIVPITIIVSYSISFSLWAANKKRNTR